MSDFEPSMLLAPAERVRLQAAHRLLSAPPAPVLRPIPADPATLSVHAWVLAKVRPKVAA